MRITGLARFIVPIVLLAALGALGALGAGLALSGAGSAAADPTAGALAAPEKKVDDLLWFQRVGDLAWIDRVFIPTARTVRSPATCAVRSPRSSPGTSGTELHS